MKWILIGLIIILLLVIILMFMKLKVKVDFLHAVDDDHFRITFKALFGLITFTYNVPFINLDKDSLTLEVKSKQSIGSKGEGNKTLSKSKQRITANELMNHLRKMKDFIENVVHLHRIVKRFLRHVTIHKFEWDSSVGLGDAAHTGIAVGIIWSLKGGIVGIISKYMKMVELPNITVTPFFQNNFVETRFICIISFRIGQAIVAALSVLKYRRNSKGGSQHVRTSNSGLNENSYGKFKAND